MNKTQTQQMKALIFGLTFALAALGFSSCTKEVPRELLESNKQQNQMTTQNMPDDSIHRSLMSPDPNPDANTQGGDELAEVLTREADAADAKYEKTKSDTDKKVCIEKQMEAANYLMFQADLPPKKKYRPALRRYRRVLELDPGNTEATANKKQIEDIYESMGMEVPD